MTPHQHREVLAYAARLAETRAGRPSPLQAIDYERLAARQYDASPTPPAYPSVCGDGARWELVARDAAALTVEVLSAAHWHVWAAHRVAGESLRRCPAPSHTTAARWIAQVDLTVWAVLEAHGLTEPEPARVRVAVREGAE